MAWAAHGVILRLRSPLHVGHSKVSNLQRTRPYVTGKTLWGALTARLTRDGFVPPNGFTPGKNPYVEVGYYVSQHLAFTYFFPAVKLIAGTQPDLTDRWLCVDNYLLSFTPLDDLGTYLFLDSYASTALDYERFGAEEGSLHEVEFISPRTRPLADTPLADHIADLYGMPDPDASELGAQVYLVGYLAEYGTSGLNWQEALGKLQLGGERGYGWGRVELVSHIPVQRNLFNSLRICDDGTSICLRAEKKALAPAHVLAALYRESGRTHPPVTGLQGVIEPWVGRETHADGAFGREPSGARICWVPGTAVPAGTVARIGPYGIWEGLITEGRIRVCGLTRVDKGQRGGDELA